MGYARIFARALLNPGPPNYSFEDINIMPFTTLLSVQIASSAREASQSEVCISGVAKIPLNREVKLSLSCSF